VFPIVVTPAVVDTTFAASCANVVTSVVTFVVGFQVDVVVVCVFVIAVEAMRGNEFGRDPVSLIEPGPASAPLPVV
jgi:hypothetical protein